MNLRHGAATMDTLISVGTLAAFGWSVYALFWGEAGTPGHEDGLHPHASTAAPAATSSTSRSPAVVIVFILAGRYFEASAKRRPAPRCAPCSTWAPRTSPCSATAPRCASRSASSPSATGSSSAPARRSPPTASSKKASSAIDASLLTGESVPVEVAPGDAVTGATVNAGGRLVVGATRVGADTALAQIARLVTDAQNGKAPVQRLADQISAVFVPVVIALALGTLGFWLGTGETPATAFTAAVAVLIIACPCALGLATPTALLVGTGRGAQLGILIKGPEVLESTRRIDTVVLDKTGTVTTGQMSLVDVVTDGGVDADDVLRLVGALEDASEHPIAQAIAAGARQRVGDLAEVRSFANLARPRRQRRRRRPRRDRRPRPAPRRLRHAAHPNSTDRQGRRRRPRPHPDRSSAGTAPSAACSSSPTPSSRPAPQAVARLRALGLTPVLLTGDNERAARAVADEVGIDTVIAEVLPADKVDVIRRLQAEGKVVAMVGDGVNDAAALAQADLGIAMGTGTDVGIEASDLTLVRGDLHVAADAIRLSRRTLGTIKTNLFWAFAYNVAALPLAAAGLLNPLIAGASMGLSSVFVVSNSLRLRRFRGA